MKVLIVGVGAIGGVIAGRLLYAGVDVSLATRDEASAEATRRTGISIVGVGGEVHIQHVDAHSVTDYSGRPFDLIILATKGQQAIEAAPQLIQLLSPEGTLLPIQNGGVPQLLGNQFGAERVLGGLSNLGATMLSRGRYEQRNAGHILIGELPGGDSKRTHTVEQWLGQAVGVRVTHNLRGAMWSKLLLNCSVTTIGAVLGSTMKEYIEHPAGREVFERAYAEALSVALASGEQPEKMLVAPIPPQRGQTAEQEMPHNQWLSEVVAHYGNLKPSMLQDFERGRTTEIDFINGYVVDLASRLETPVPLNRALVEIVKSITNGSATPSMTHFQTLVNHI